MLGERVIYASCVRCYAPQKRPRSLPEEPDLLRRELLLGEDVLLLESGHLRRSWERTHVAAQMLREGFRRLLGIITDVAIVGTELVNNYAYTLWVKDDQLVGRLKIARCLGQDQAIALQTSA